MCVFSLFFNIFTIFQQEKFPLFSEFFKITFKSPNPRNPLLLLLKKEKNLQSRYFVMRK